MISPAPTAALKVSVTVIMLFQVAALFSREWLRRTMVDGGTAPAFAHELSAWAGFAVLSVLMWPYLYQQRACLAALFRHPVSWLRLLFFSIAIGISMRLASWGLAVLNHAIRPDRWPVAGTPLRNELHWQCPEPGFLLISLVTMVAAAPLLEEVINRGLILGAFLRRDVRWPALASGVLFAILHRPDTMLAAFIFGIVAASQVMNGRSLWGPLVAHATFNSLIVIDSYCLDTGIAVLALLPPGPINRIALGATVAGVFSLLALWFARHSGTGTAGPGTGSGATTPVRRVQ